MTRVGQVPTLPSAVAALFAALALATAFDRSPERVRDAVSRLGDDPGTRIARRLEPAVSHSLSEQALRVAEKTIPRDARFTVVTGDDPPLDPAVAVAAQVFIREWLLPRVYVRRPEDADWVVAYHYSTERLPVHGREIGMGPDANLLEVQR